MHVQPGEPPHDTVPKSQKDVVLKVRQVMHRLLRDTSTLLLFMLVALLLLA